MTQIIFTTVKAMT